MESLQTYKSFIDQYKRKLISSCIDLIRVVETEIIPRIKEILESYDENFKTYDVNLIDGGGGGIDHKCLRVLRLENIGEWTIHIGVETLPDKKSTLFTKNNLLKEICDRILAEFPDDLMYNYCGGNEILLDIKS
jgi:hypothetical protein